MLTPIDISAMKINCTFLVTLCLCLPLFNGYSQTTKGSLLLGGALKFSSRQSESTHAYPSLTTKTKEISFTISPDLAYFVIDRLAVGLVTPFTYSRYRSGDLQSTHSTYSIGPMVRYYFLLGRQWAIFPEVSYRYGWIERNGPYLVPNNNGGWDVDFYKTSGITKVFQSGVGLTYFLKPNIGIEAKVSYQSSNDSYRRDDVTDPIVSREDKSLLGFTIGVQMYFARKM
jgi:outer membrane protein W